ncbi:hypothetical protein LSUE1_G004861 [Lachnellula suecica]|uniref:MYND-type domain-containing protein n=1 Tax=Lachnellula suecica TaxID=602035 RepID=A0A8T9CLD1_9HELO|nr:hypothetical protein LSUE1_G004861 [Lachnellula suecica]
MATSTPSATPPTGNEFVCNTCKKPATSFPNPLKKCAKCQVTKYCSRECQKDDWKAHKKICSAQSQSGDSKPSSSGGRHNPGFNFAEALTGGGNSLHSLSEKDAFTQIIDCFRLRCEDEYTFGANTIGIYDGKDPVPAFKKFLNLAEKREEILPGWWNQEKRTECVEFATGGSEWADLSCAVEKSDIQEHYGDPTKPMALRVLGEKIYGKGFM